MTLYQMKSFGFFFKSQTFQQSEFCSIAKFILKNGEVLFGKRCPPVRKSWLKQLIFTDA